MRLSGPAILPGCLALLALAPLASANVMQVTVSGNINSSNMGAFPVGQLVTVTLVYESSGTAQLISNNQAFHVDKIQSVSVVSGTYNSSYNTGTFGQINKFNNLSSTDGIVFQMERVQAGYQFTNPKPRAIQLASVVSGGVTQTLDSVRVNIANAPTTAWHEYNLPVFFDLTQFAQQSLGFGFSGGGFGVDSATAVVKDLTASRIPVVTSVTPANAAVGQALTVTVNGSGFVAGDTVCWSPSAGTANCTSPTTFVNTSQLTAAIPATLATPAGSATVQVATSLQVFSNPLSVVLANAPQVSSISPASAQAGGAAFTLTVTGTGFVAGSTVQWNGEARSTTFGSATQLTAAITAADIAAAGSAAITVATPAPVLTSQPVSFTISPPNNPVPTVTAISPATALAQSTGLSVLVTGTNFVAGSIVRWNGSARATSQVSATQLAAAITANDLLNVGTASVTVFNPAPGGGTSAAASFTVTNPAPAISSISPAAGTAGANGFTMTVNGQNFVQGANVQWNGSSRTTTLVSATQLRATIAAADLLNEGTSQVTVLNPTPGGGSSNAAGFTTGPATGGSGIPTITSISPTTAPAGSAGFTLTVNGTNFTPSTVVRRNGSNRTTVYVSSTLLRAFVYPDDLLGTGSDQISVFTPPPGGGGSNITGFTISAAVSNPIPEVSTPIPSLVYSGVNGFTITLVGTGFVPGSVVRWNGANLITTYLSALSVSALVPANLVTASGIGNVVVFSPSPGGGLSPTYTIRIVGAPASNPIPVVTSFFPTSWSAGASEFILKILGTGFVPGSTVFINGRSRVVTFVSDTLLWVNMTLADAALSGSLQITVSNPAPGGGAAPVKIFTVLPPPVITSGGIINAASLRAGQLTAAAGIGALFGLNFSVDTVLTSTVPWPTTLAGLSLKINGILAPLLYVTPQQLGFQFPWELVGLTRVTVEITQNGVTSAPETITLAPYSPGVFTMTQTGSGQGAVLIAGTATLAAAPGSVPGQVCQPVPKLGFISMYTTGLGAVDNPPANGAAGGADPLSRTVTLPTLTVGGVSAKVLFSGLAPSLVGVYQVNAEIPANAPSGNAVLLELSIGGVPSNPVTIAIQ